MWPPAGVPGFFFFFSLVHPICFELPISAHVACACVCRRLYVLRASHALVQATVGVGTVLVVYIGVAYTKGGGYEHQTSPPTRATSTDVACPCGGSPHAGFPSKVGSQQVSIALQMHSIGHHWCWVVRFQEHVCC